MAGIIRNSENILEELVRLLEEIKIIKKNGCWGLEIGDGISITYYGYIRIKKLGEDILAHRLSAFIYLKLDLNDKEQLALHKNTCHNRRCWNPDHLYIGNRFDNARDKKELGLHKSIGQKMAEARIDITHCRKGHKYSIRKDNGYKICAECNRIRSNIWNLKQRRKKS